MRDAARFTEIFAHKQRMHATYFNAHTAPNDLGFARIGLAVSRRVSKRAVERNRVKRIIRESFRRRQLALGAVDYIVIAKTGAAAQPSRALHAELDHLWQRARRKCAR
ncbi:MAG: ribonuclease P protein component [bacterium]